MNVDALAFLRGLLPLFTLALLLTGCAASSITGSQPAATVLPPTSTPAGALPTFSDWRVAYIGQDGTLHAISQNGASDSRVSAAGEALPLMEQSSYAVFSAGTSPDGHYFAYSSDQTYIINLAAHNVPTLPLATLAYAPSALCWSPDSKRLAIDDASQGWSIVDVATDQAMLVPGSVAAQAELLGWIDATHLLGLTGHPGDSTRILLSLDVSSGARRTIATVSTGSLSNPIFVLSPDGKQVLLYNIVGGEWDTIPYRPFVAVIYTATGQQQPLPKIAQLTNGGFESVAWKPGTETVAVAIAGPWLLDLARDTAIRLPGDQFPLGWAPDTGALVLSDLGDLRDQVLPGGGIVPSAVPHLISIMPSLSAAPQVLVQAAYALPFVGFVRTA